MPRQKKSILIISSEFPPDPGGIGNHAYNLALGFVAEDFIVTVVADINSTIPDELKAFGSKQPFKFKPIMRKKTPFVTYAKRLLSSVLAVRNNNYIICSGKFSLWQVSLLKILYPFKKYIAVVHGTELDLKGRYAKKLTGFSLNRFNAVVAVSLYTKSFLPLQVKQKKQVAIIPNGINNIEFQAALLNKPGFVISPETSLPVITIGNVTERKGQENVIRALPALIAAFPRIHYHIAGRPTCKERLLKIAASLGVTEYITFHGMLPRQELINLISRCAVKFMLSNHTKDGDFEGFGIAILEANALGIPAIGSNFGGITDAIDNNASGKLVDINNSQDITSALQEITGAYNYYSANALQWARQHDWSILIKKYITVLDAVN